MKKEKVYCIKCKKSVVINKYELDSYEDKRGIKRYRIIGVCPNCGTKVTKMISKKLYDKYKK